MEKGWFDFHKMTVNCQCHLLKLGPQIIKQKDHKNFLMRNFDRR